MKELEEEVLALESQIRSLELEKPEIGIARIKTLKP